MFHLTPLEQIYPLKKLKWVFRTRPFEVMIGSEDTLKIVLKGKLKYVQKGSSGTYLTMANLKLKPSLFMPTLM